MCFDQDKSKHDWDGFKHEEGITEELTTHNRGKDGYANNNYILYVRTKDAWEAISYAILIFYQFVKTTFCYLTVIIIIIIHSFYRAMCQQIQLKQVLNHRYGNSTFNVDCNAQLFFIYL